MQSLTTRVSANLKAFKRVRTSFDSRARRTFYISFVQSVLEYASNAYVHSLHSSIYDKLIKLSKRAQRYVFGYPSRAHTAPFALAIISFLLMFALPCVYICLFIAACTGVPAPYFKLCLFPVQLLHALLLLRAPRPSLVFPSHMSAVVLAISPFNILQLIAVCFTC